MSIWTPSNKYEADLMVKLEATTFQLRQAEMELARLKDDLYQYEQQIVSLEESFAILKSPSVKIVSIRAYADMKRGMPELYAIRKNLNAAVAQQQQMVNALESMVRKLKQDIERSRFKILEFKRERS